MIATLRRKLRTADDIVRTQGLRGLLDEVRTKVASLPNRWHSWAQKWIYGVDNPLLGRVVELRGDLVRVDGCTFSVASPAISTSVKSRFLFDRYERPERIAVARFLDPQLPVLEFGAAVGVVSCITNKRLLNPSQHVVVEANPSLLDVLARNRDANGCGFTIVHRAIAHGSDVVTFSQAENYLGSSAHATTGKPITVPATTLEALLDEFGFDRCTLICDIEGGEEELVSSEPEVLRRRVRAFIVEVHPWVLGQRRVAEVLRSIEACGFERMLEQDTTYVFQSRVLEAVASATTA